MIHDYNQSRERGERHERVLDEHYRLMGAEIVRASTEEQKVGVDRWFTWEGKRFSVDYKADEKARKTGNAFLELGDLGRYAARQGCVYRTKADWIVYYIVHTGAIYWFRPTDLTTLVDEEWVAAYGVKAAPNKHYWTIGVAVPLVAFEAAAHKKDNVNRAAA